MPAHMTTTRDIPRTATAMPQITIYGPEICPRCESLIGIFTRKNIAFTKIVIEAGDENHQYVKHTLGYNEAPVVVLKFVEDRIVHWGGHRMDLITCLLRLHGKGITPAAQPTADEAGSSAA